MIKEEKSFIKYIFLVGLSDKLKEDILENFNESLSFNYLAKVLSYYSSEGINSVFNLVKENYVADLILVNSNPLDDVSILSENDNILKVIQDGIEVKN